MRSQHHDGTETTAVIPYAHYEEVVQSRHIHFYISGSIEDPPLYTDMIYAIQTATENDCIYVHLNTTGGQLDTGVQIINALKTTPAYVVTLLEGPTHSLGTLIFLSGQEMVVNDNCMMMFHNFSGGVNGKGNEITKQLTATVQWFSLLAKKIYVPFLSEEEISKMERGEDLWIHSPEIRKRLDRMVDAANKPKGKIKQKNVQQELDLTQCN
jgi:ATP-dependent protease ClpP protease subunit